MQRFANGHGIGPRQPSPEEQPNQFARLQNFWPVLNEPLSGPL